MTEPEPREELFSALGVTISPDLLIQALTHRSFSHEHPGTSNYERLEFLGDAVLELVSTETLFTLHPDMTEGQLAKMRAKAVSEEALSAIARDKLHVGPFILLGHGEAESGGAEKSSILCDIVESLIGATFLEHGIEGARKVVHRLIDDTLAEVATEGPALDWKTSLTVKAHELGLDEPRYRMSVSGPDSPPRPPSARKTTSSARVPAPASARRSSPRRKWPGMSSTGTRPRSRRPARTARPSTGAAARPATDQLVNGDCAMLSPVCLN